MHDENCRDACDSAPRAAFVPASGARMAIPVPRSILEDAKRKAAGSVARVSSELRDAEAARDHHLRAAADAQRKVDVLSADRLSAVAHLRTLEQLLGEI